GIAELEKHPIRVAGAVVGTGVLDAGRTLYEEAVRLRLARRDEAGAFAYVERAHTHLAASPGVEALIQHLAGRGAAVLELAVVGDELVAFCVTERGMRVSRAPFSGAILAADAVTSNDPQVLGKLYDLL